jgi:uncharacterized secreted protein with C-terminal beta-propeller domain
MRYLLALILLLGALPGVAATSGAPPLSQRSALLPGLWWDPEQPGQGFDLHLSGPTLGVIWYSYRASGEPIWYLASGDIDADGHWQAELLRLRWDDGVVESRVIGSLSLQRQHSESARLDWNVAGRSGQWRLEPFRLTAQRAEVDPSGAYHDPASDGFGLSLDQQGDGLSAIYYVYDQDGEPSWWLGHRSSAAQALQLKSYLGPCPGCAARAVEEQASIEARIETDAHSARLLLGAGSAQLQPDFRQLETPLQRFTPAVAERQADYRLASFDDAGSLRAYLEAAIFDDQQWRRSTAGADLSPQPPAQPISFSVTNQVVEGVDEPDLLKSDGRFAYALQSTPDSESVRIIELAGNGIDPQPRGELALPFEVSLHAQRGGLLLSEDALIYLQTDSVFLPGLVVCPPPPFHLLQLKTRIAVFDRSEGARPQLRWSAELDGHMIEARRIGAQLYLILRYAPHIQDFRYSVQNQADREHNAALLAATSLSDLLPRIHIDGRSLPLFEPASVHLPPAARAAARPDFVSVLRIAIADPALRDSVAVVGGVAAAHVSRESVFVTSSRYTLAADAQLREQPGVSTDIHRIAIEETGLRVASSGSVDGLLTADALLQPFRLSEQDSVLRIVTEGNFGAHGRNRLHLLAESELLPGLLKTVSTLPNAERPAAIGKPDEILYATRFAGNRLFAVTFQQIDPLYVIDLADPTDPAIRGELELPGFSDYLHPFGTDLLLGLGHHVPMPSSNPTLMTGVKLSLFDVADSARPTVLQEVIIGERGSDSAALQSHRAFAVLPLAEHRWRIGLPMRVHGEPSPPPGAPAGSGIQPHTHSALYSFDLDATEPGLTTLQAMIAASALGDYEGREDDREARALLTGDAALLWRGGAVFAAPWSDLGQPLGPR